MAHSPLGPVEADRPWSDRLGHIELRRPSGWRIVSQQHPPGISRLTRNDEHASTALSKAEELLFGRLSNGGKVDVDLKDGKLTFEFVERAKLSSAKKPPGGSGRKKKTTGPKSGREPALVD